MQECQVAKRNERLAAALGITRGEDGKASSLGQSETKYAEKLQQFWKANATFAASVEKSLSDFVSSEKKLIVLRPMPPPKRKFVRDLAEMYRLDATDVDPEPRRSVELRRRVDTRVPKPLLSEVINPPKAAVAGPSTSAWGKSPASSSSAPLRPAWGQRAAPGTSGAAAPWSAVVHNAAAPTAGSSSSRPRTPVLPEPRTSSPAITVANPAPIARLPPGDGPSSDVPSSWDED
ncbi:FKBP12-associated protein [Tulasnella sp. 417]|nr:FKBP12-associated protein [Tulasnella sp. 417]